MAADDYIDFCDADFGMEREWLAEKAASEPRSQNFPWRCDLCGEWAPILIESGDGKNLCLVCEGLD